MRQLLMHGCHNSSSSDVVHSNSRRIKKAFGILPHKLDISKFFVTRNSNSIKTEVERVKPLQRDIFFHQRSTRPRHQSSLEHVHPRVRHKRKVDRVKHIALVATVSEVTPAVLGTHSVVSSVEPEKKSDKINELTREESVQTSERSTQKFEHLSSDNLPSAQSFLKMNEASKFDDKTPNQ